MSTDTSEATEVAKVTAEYLQIFSTHYNETFDQTIRLWHQRNRTFIYLVLVTGVATLLRLQIPEADSLFIDMVVKVLNIQSEARIAELRNTFPFEKMQTILLVVIFYLMVNLYHRAYTVLKNYRYLSGLEKEMRQFLSLPESSMFFTRESSFYWKDRHLGLRSVKYFYFGIVAFLLIIVILVPVSNFLRKLAGSFQTVDIFDIMNLGIIVGIAGYYVSYVLASRSLDCDPSDNEQP